MNDLKFHTVMRAIDDDLLEEAKRPRKRKKPFLYGIPAAVACLLLLVGLSFFQNQNPVNDDTLAAMGYEFHIPAEAANIRYRLLNQSQPEVAQACFVLDGESYTYEIVKTAAPLNILGSTNPEASVLSWFSKDLEMSMVASIDSTSLNWYSPDSQTQHCIFGSMDSEKLLQTGRQILLLTGLDPATAPATATDVNYHVFQYENLVVVETTFTYNRLHYSYRMAATSNTTSNLVDISQQTGDYTQLSQGKVDYCNTTAHITSDGKGKLLWLDVVPGIVYSLSVEQGGDADTLLEIANDIFTPAQGNNP